MRPREPGVKKPNAPSAPPVTALSEVLLRLPDMASLANAALVEKRWYGVASDPAVFGRFDALRRPPLLGFILTDRGDQLFPRRCSNLIFVPATRGYSDLASAAADADIFFEELPDVDSDDDGYWDDWRLRGCASGRLLLSRGRDGLVLAIYDPIARTAVFLQTFDVFRYSTHMVRYAIVVDVADGSFLVIGVVEFRAAVYSSRPGKWMKFEGDAFLKTSKRYEEWDWYDEGDEVATDRRSEWHGYDQDDFDSIGQLPGDGMVAGRFAYWRSDTKKCKYYNVVERILVLDTSTMELSVIAAPFPPGESYCVADMPEHGVLCLFSSKEQCLRFWVRNIIGEWVLKNELSLLNERLKKLIST